MAGRRQSHRQLKKAAPSHNDQSPARKDMQTNERSLSHDSTVEGETRKEEGAEDMLDRRILGSLLERNNTVEASVIHADERLSELGVKRIGPQSSNQELRRINRMCSNISEDYLSDYGDQERHWNDFWLYEPKNEEEAILGLERAHQLGIRTTIRGSGHSMNGSSLPTNGGLLILTTSLNKVVIYPSGEVDVGAGVQVLIVDEFIRRFGLCLPVVNDGGAPAPTIGGFICAGGFGVSSNEYGGFWNHVSSVRCWIPGKGTVTMCRGEDSFWNLFGCGKPEGVILSATLTTLGNYTGNRISSHLDFQYVEHPRRIWFTFLAPEKKTSALRRAIIRLDKELEPYWQGLPPYEYIINGNGAPIPPGFFPNHHGSLAAIGVWGLMTEKGNENIHAIIKKIRKFTEQETYVRRYWQSELGIESPHSWQNSDTTVDGNQRGYIQAQT